MYQSHNLSHTDTMIIVAAIQESLDKDNLGAALAVVDSHGERLAFLRTVGRESLTEQFPITNFGDLRYTRWGGGMPIEYDGQVVGTVGVSGLPETDESRWCVWESHSSLMLCTDRQLCSMSVQQRCKDGKLTQCDVCLSTN